MALLLDLFGLTKQIIGLLLLNAVPDMYNAGWLKMALGVITVQTREHLRPCILLSHARHFAQDASADHGSKRVCINAAPVYGEHARSQRPGEGHLQVCGCVADIG